MPKLKLGQAKLASMLQRVTSEQESGKSDECETVASPEISDDDMQPEEPVAPLMEDCSFTNAWVRNAEDFSAQDRER